MKNKENNAESISKPLISPLRYPGSKRRLVGYIEEAIRINDLKPSLYVEPFVGGGSVALQLLQDKMVEKVILMDLDPLIASFWEVVFSDHEWLCDQIRTIDVTLEKWSEFKNSQPGTLRDFALTCLFLNRTNFSGILQEKVGPLGGRKQESEYKIDCRFPRETLIDRIEQIVVHKDRIHGVWNSSWDEGVRRVRQEQTDGLLPLNNLFYYFDPPFFENAEALYRFYFQYQDHKKLRDQLLSFQDKWILSYDSAEQVEALYGNAIKNRTNGTRKHDVERIYSVSIMSKRKRGREVILSNLEKLPTIVNS
jgi:DNA adenine methylase